MKRRSTTDAKANISNAVDETSSDGPQAIVGRGSDRALMAAESRKRPTDGPFTMADLVLNSPIEDSDLPERRPARAIARDFF